MEPNLNSISSVCDGNHSHLCADSADRAIVVLVPLNSSWLRQQDTLFKQLSHILESGAVFMKESMEHCRKGGKPGKRLHALFETEPSFMWTLHTSGAGCLNTGIL